MEYSLVPFHGWRAAPMPRSTERRPTLALWRYESEHSRLRPRKLFAGKWAEAVSPQVEVAVPLRPIGDVPMLDNRCVDVAPFIENDGYNEVGPDAWVKIGGWLGTMHRLARGVEDSAPVALDYGNHPHEGLFDRYLEQARIGCTSDAHLKLMRRVDSATQRISQAVGSHLEDLPVGGVHGDLHFWNVLYRADQPACIIDLDFLQQGILLHDVAYASHWLKEWAKRGGVWSDITARVIELGVEVGISPETLWVSCTFTRWFPG